MKILAIETSCDETAVSIVEAENGLMEPHFSVLGTALFSQVQIHAEYGGVFPSLAKREHAKNLPPLLVSALTKANMFTANNRAQTVPEDLWQKIERVLEREDGLFAETRKTFSDIQKPDIDMIAVTEGPGLEPALWVGISFAKALSLLWDLPLRPVNHMEGHIASVLLKTDAVESEKTKVNSQIQFPAVALLISGGHTELVEVSGWGKYKIVGQTKDDAVGEAFDKVARMLGLPYPGGPQISKLAEKARKENLPKTCVLPRPMINSKDLNFSFSGLKTAVLYYIRDHISGPLSEDQKMDLAREFEDSVIEVLISKTRRAIDNTGARTLIIGGGVIANARLRETFVGLETEYGSLEVKVPSKDMATDNAVMIACVAYINHLVDSDIKKDLSSISAKGNLRLG